MEIHLTTTECHLPYGTMLPATRHKRTHPAFTPARQAGTLFTDHLRNDGGLSMPRLTYRYVCVMLDCYCGCGSCYCCCCCCSCYSCVSAVSTCTTSDLEFNLVRLTSAQDWTEINFHISLTPLRPTLVSHISL